MANKDELVRLNTEDMGPKVKEFLEMLRCRVKGQDMALRDVATAYERHVSGLKRRDKPIFCGLFLGPSGVGKTHVSEILAEHLFGHRGALCKIKCGDFKQEHQIASLIGSPPGYVGHQDPNDPERYNPESPHPMLSQWNLDRYDAEHLEKENSDERKKFIARNKKHREAEELKKIAEEIAKLQAEIVKLEKEVDQLEKQQASLPREKQWKPARKVVWLRKQILELKAKETEAEARLKEATRIHAEERAVLQKWYKSMAERGIIYDANISCAYTSIVLFDEIEKADESLHHMLFEIMDKGELQLANGRTTSFRNCFVFMTGNVGEQEITDIMSGNANIGFRQQSQAKEQEANNEIYKVAVAAAKKIFPPPFLGRLDKIVVFRPLQFDTMLEILDVHIAELLRDFFEADKVILLELEEPVKKFLVEQSMEGGRNAYGARNLKARLDKFIVSKLIRALSNGSLKPPAEVYAKLEEVNGKKRVVFESTECVFPGEQAVPKKDELPPNEPEQNNKTNP